MNDEIEVKFGAAENEMKRFFGEICTICGFLGYSKILDLRFLLSPVLSAALSSQNKYVSGYYRGVCGSAKSEMSGFSLQGYPGVARWISQQEHHVVLH